LASVAWGESTVGFAGGERGGGRFIVVGLAGRYVFLKCLEGAQDLPGMEGRGINMERCRVREVRGMVGIVVTIAGMIQRTGAEESIGGTTGPKSLEVRMVIGGWSGAEVSMKGAMNGIQKAIGTTGTIGSTEASRRTPLMNGGKRAANLKRKRRRRKRKLPQTLRNSR